LKLEEGYKFNIFEEVKVVELKDRQNLLDKIRRKKD
jgi:hypothetical protein